MGNKSMGEITSEARYEVAPPDSKPTTSPLNLVTLSAQRDSSVSPRSPQDGQTKLPAVTFEDVLRLYGTTRNGGRQDTEVYPDTSRNSDHPTNQTDKQTDRQEGAATPALGAHPRVESPPHTKPEARVEPSSAHESWPRTVLPQPERQALAREHDTPPANCANNNALRHLNIGAGIISFAAAVVSQSPQGRALWFFLGAANLGSAEHQRLKIKSLCTKDSKH